MKTVLLSFADDVTRDHFLRIIKSTADTLAASGLPTKNDAEILQTALNTVRLDPPIKADHERVVALFVSGKKMVEGTLAQMRTRFQQEVDSHSASVTLRELQDGTWKEIQARRVQSR